MAAVQATQDSWRTFGASVTGKAHLDKDIPCQDAHAHTVVGDVLVAIVCDGAGSARLSEQGAQFVATQTVQALAGRLEQGATVQDLLDGALAGTLAQIRAALDDIARAANATLDDYAATVVGVVMGADNGFFFHLGDGLGVAQLGDGGELISLPANGEYANETYFISGERWREQLRLLPIPQSVRGVVLMSDGCMPFAMSKNNAALYAPFMDAVQGYLRTVESIELGNEALASTLADPRTHQITGDDKTLLLALRA
ncbi:PP2C family serine/threonine-protein phosphatase [Janthinobacterium aestuarii]